MWIIKTEHKRDADGGIAALELETEDKRFDVNIRWDGCAEIHVYSIEENRDINDTFHTCDLKGIIDVLQSLNNVCKDYFGKGSYWEDTDDVKSV
ncbi:hypothetical protein [Paenibacillus sp. XY044]|uniref:hypothetical protein n=1 Tax=Paenibacillus sp. XY044 TaxID=2026089 RepID=UPI000B998002|nr:hypothetical protein [Paenibacillus sp. XY044]OZB94090.1 hypothetical protein CJP46_17895 [Paenibacillus sp. XY044]